MSIGLGCPDDARHALAHAADNDRVIFSALFYTGMKVVIVAAGCRFIALSLATVSLLVEPAHAAPPVGPAAHSPGPSSAGRVVLTLSDASETDVSAVTRPRPIDDSAGASTDTEPESALGDRQLEAARAEPASIPEPRPSQSPSANGSQAQKKKADELKKKVLGAYKDPFYLNDFSYVNDPNYRGTNLGEGLKQIPVGSQGKLDVGGQYRLRYHHEHNIRGLGLTGRDDDFLLDRTRVYFDYRMNQRVRLFSEFLDAGSSYENFAPRPIEVNQLDAQNLFADVVMVDSSAGKLTARGGRQELLFGAQRLLSPLDWANTRRTFEGGRLTWSSGENTTDALLVRPVVVAPRQFDAPNQDQVLYGLYHSNKSLGVGPVDIYYLGLEDDRTFTRVHTLGTLIKGEADDLLWDNEFGYQFGRNPDGSDIAAFSLTFGAGRKLKSSLKPTLWLYYDWASGDDSTGNGWNQLFPLSHRYFGFMDLFGRRNIHDINSLLTFNATEKLSVLAWYHYLALSNGNQGPYNVTGTAFNPGGTVGSRDLGHEIDLLGTYKINPRSDLVLGYSHFFAGKYYQTSLNAQGLPLFDGDADFLYTQWHYNF